MHDLDRTQLEMSDTGEFEAEPSGYELDSEFEFEAPTGVYGGADLSEIDEMELAGDFLEIQDEAELDQFLGKLFKKLGQGARKILSSPIGKQLGGILKGAAKKLLPVAGGVLGGIVGGPAGAALGSNLAGGAAQAMGLEVEGLSSEDQEFEVARQYVRFATAAVQNAAAAPPAQPPAQAARSAAVDAARQHAPGLLRQPGRKGPVSSQRSGRWVRRGNRIVLFGV
ncbi:MAG: hypothetical protein J0H49_03575 [Acidobacteria bacterium]|nr:hypothetical protein [Acidobacteriota bacterium]